MAPEFDDFGFLPPGIHRMKMSEFESIFAIFNRSDRRIRLYDGLKRLCEAAQKVGFIKRIIVAGSYVTAKAEPNDFDCLVVIDAESFPENLRPFEYQLVSRQLARRQFGGDVIPIVEGTRLYEHYLQFFQHTRDGREVGIVEIEA